MTYAIIGSGNIGSAIARQLVKLGSHVKIANSTGPESIKGLADELGSDLVPTDLQEAIKADVVILAVPFEAALELVATVSDWGNRIVVDASNALNYADFTPLDLGGKPSSQAVAEAARGARIVKAFNHDFAQVLSTDPSDGQGGKRVLFLSGSNPAANARISELMTAIGFKAVDLGRLDGGGLLQQFGGPLTSLNLVSRAVAA